MPFDWRLPEFYAYAHSLRPELLIGNHSATLEGEDFQMFERNLPAGNACRKAGKARKNDVDREVCEWSYDKKTKALTLSLPDHAEKVDLVVEIIVQS